MYLFWMNYNGSQIVIVLFESKSFTIKCITFFEPVTFSLFHKEITGFLK